MTETSLKVTVPMKLAMAAGWPVEGVMLVSFELFLLFFYTQVLGLSGALTGLALLLAMIVDGISDPVVGTFSDNLRNARWGRRHSLMFLAPLPLALAFFAVFNPPASFHGLALFAWLTVTAVAARVACAFFIIPYSTQVAEVSREAPVRASIAIFKSVALTVFQFLLIWASFKFFFAASPGHESGQEVRSSYLPFALFWAVVMVLLIGISSFGTYGFMRRIEAAIPMKPPERLSLPGFLRTWRTVLGSPSNVRVIFIGAIVSGTASSIGRALTAHMGVYFWRLTPSQISLWQQAAIPGTFVGLFVVLALVRRVNCRPIYLVGSSLAYLCLTAPVALHLLGYMPTGEAAAGFHTLLAINLISGVGAGFGVMISGLMSAEAADELQLRLGSPQQGLMFGFIFLATKIGSGLGKLFSGIALDIIHFPVGKPARLVPVEEANRLGLMMIVCVLVPGVVGLWIWSRYSITRQRHRQITTALAAQAAEARTVMEAA